MELFMIYFMYVSFFFYLPCIAQIFWEAVTGFLKRPTFSSDSNLIGLANTWYNNTLPWDRDGRMGIIITALQVPLSNVHLIYIKSTLSAAYLTHKAYTWFYLQSQHLHGQKDRGWTSEFFWIVLYFKWFWEVLWGVFRIKSRSRFLH